MQEYDRDGHGSIYVEIFVVVTELTSIADAVYNREDYPHHIPENENASSHRVGHDL